MSDLSGRVLRGRDRPEGHAVEVVEADEDELPAVQPPRRTIEEQKIGALDLGHVGYGGGLPVLPRVVGPDVSVNVHEVDKIKGEKNASKPPPIVVSCLTEEEGYSVFTSKI